VTPKHLVLLFGALLSASALMAQSDKPVTAVVENGSYRLGPGDSVHIQVFGENDLSRDVKLGEDGRINYAFVGQIELSGQTMAEVEQTITEMLLGDYLLNPQVSVTIAAYRPFFMNGEVKTPGSYAYQPGLTVSKAISLAGGMTERASDRKIFMIPEGGLEADRMRVTLDDEVAPGVTITIEQSFF